MKTEDLAAYYQEELRALRTDAAAFAGRYPGLAPRLGLAAGQTTDPMVERLVECMAWFAARLRQDSEARLPLAAQQVLSLLHPYFACPVPSVAVAALTPPEGYAKTNPSGSVVPAGTSFHSLDAGGAPVRWRTAWPLLLHGTKARLRSISENRLHFMLDDLGDVRTLRLYPVGDPYSVYPLFDWVNCNLRDVTVDSSRTNAKATLRAIGYERKDFVFPESNAAHPAYQIVQEYFACPARFLFWELALENIPPENAKAGKSLSVCLSFKSPIPSGLLHANLSLETNAVPVVNLFERLSEPIRVDGARHCYPVFVPGADGEIIEPHSILDVEAIGYGKENGPIRKHFGTLPRRADASSVDSLSWYARRRPGVDGGCLIELFFKSAGGSDQPFIASARLRCTNRDEASSLGAEAALHRDDPLDAEDARLLSPPSPYRPPPMNGDEIWRFVSAMTLHCQSLTGEKGTRAIRDILSIFAPSEDEQADAQIRGVRGFACRPAVEPLRASASLPCGGVARGHDFDLRLDPDAFRGASLFIFSSVLETFLGLYCGLNSFTRLAAWRDGAAEPFRAWPARNGERRL